MNVLFPALQGALVGLWGLFVVYGSGWCLIGLLLGDKREAARWEDPRSRLRTGRAGRSAIYVCALIFGALFIALAATDFADVWRALRHS